MTHCPLGIGQWKEAHDRIEIDPSLGNAIIEFQCPQGSSKDQTSNTKPH